MVENNRPSFLLEEKLTYKLRGIFIEISKEHGCLYKEKVYQKLLKEAFKNKGIKSVSHPRIPIYNIETGKFIEYYYPDFLIENKIIVEIKAQSQILNIHINQLIKYLNSSKYEIGLLANFGTPKIQTIRRIYTNDRKPFLHY